MINSYEVLHNTHNVVYLTASACRWIRAGNQKSLSSFKSPTALPISRLHHLCRWRWSTSLGNPLCRSGMLDAQTCGEMRTLFRCSQPSAEISTSDVQRCRHMQTCLGQGHPSAGKICLAPFCAADVQTCGEIRICLTPRNPFAGNEGRTSDIENWKNCNFESSGVTLSHETRFEHQ